MTAAALPPGPRILRPVQAALWGLRYPQFTSAGHARFGSTFTVRPGTMDPVVLTTDRDAIKRLFTGDPLAKRHGNDVVRPLIGDGSLMLLDPPEHLARRKLLLPPFHGERVRAYAELMERLMRDEVARWSRGDMVAMLPSAQNVTIEVILEAVLGVADPETRKRFRRLIDDLLFYPLGALRLRVAARVAPRLRLPPRVREAAAFASSLPTPAVMTYFPELKSRARWNVGTRPWWRHRDRLIALLDEHISSVRDDPRLDERKDILAILVRARGEDGGSIPHEDLQQDLITLIGAGHETTASAIAWAAVLLAHHPEIQQRAATAAREGEDAYLAAVVKEVLRLRSPIPVAAVRVLDEPFEVDSHTVPAGTMILIDAWGIHHDPGVFPEPERFAPERFLEAQPEAYTWLPFGGGAHRCLGAALAELEIRVALTTILREVALSPDGAHPPPPARRGVTLVPHGGGRVRIG